MVRFENLLVKAFPTDFKFVNQRKVKLVGLFGSRLVSYELSKCDVLRAIDYYTKRIHFYTDKAIRSEGMNFPAFKMHDLVPYLYTLINLYLHVIDCEPFEYVRSLPELKLTRFCHLPFEDEIIIESEQLPVLHVKYAILPSPDDENISKYVCLSRIGIICVDTLTELESELNCFYPRYRIILRCDLPF